MSRKLQQFARDNFFFAVVLKKSVSLCYNGKYLGQNINSVIQIKSILKTYFSCNFSHFPLRNNKLHLISVKKQSVLRKVFHLTYKIGMRINKIASNTIFVKRKIVKKKQFAEDHFCLHKT